MKATFPKAYLPTKRKANVAARTDKRTRAPIRTRQTRKASTTRFRILEGALDSLLDLGYAETSISTICERANLSRGATQFHFPTRQAVFEALIGHLAQRRLDLYRTDLAKISPGNDFLDHAIDVYWRQVTRPEFIAHQELVLAARNDPRLAEQIARGMREFIRHSRQPFLDEFPQWRELGARYETAANIAQYLLEGMAWGCLNRHLDQNAVKALLQEAKAHVRAILEGTNQVVAPDNRPRSKAKRKSLR